MIIGVSRVVPRVPRHHPKHLKNIFINNDLIISLYSRLWQAVCFKILDILSCVVHSISLVTNPISFVTNPISLMTNPISLMANSFANLQAV